MSHNLIVLSCDPEAKLLWDGWAAIHSIELLWALWIELLAGTWFTSRSWGNSNAMFLVSF